jgi:hypothetical protein
VHESSGIAQELVWFRKDQVEVPSETLPFFHKEWGKILEFIFRVNSTKFAISWFTFIQNFDIKKMKRKHSSTTPLRKFLHLGLG